MNDAAAPHEQGDFASALLNPDIAAPTNLVSPDGTPAGARFDVYRNNVTVSLLDAMRSGFPVIEKLLGPSNFQILALNYIRAHPPQSPVLMFYGEGFDQFIANFDPLKKLVYLPDVARLELARRTCYHAADSGVFDATAMAALGEDAMMSGYLHLAPATQIVPSAYPLFDIWLRNSGGDDHPIGKQAQGVLLTRPNMDVQSVPVDAGMIGFLTLLQNNTVGQAIETTLAQTPDFPLGDALELILTSGLACKHSQEIS